MIWLMIKTSFLINSSSFCGIFVNQTINEMYLKHFMVGEMIHYYIKVDILF